MQEKVVILDRQALSEEIHERLNVATRLREAMSDGHTIWHSSFGCPRLKMVFQEVLDNTPKGIEYFRQFNECANSSGTTVTQYLEDAFPRPKGMKS